MSSVPQLTCPACSVMNPAEKRFCGDCGAPLSSGCPGCGATNPPGKRFCGDCGAPIAGGAAGGDSHAGGAAGSPGSGRAAGGTPGDAAASAERRLVTVLFADLVGFTPFSEGRDAEEVRETLSRYFDLARGVIERYGGTVEKFIGDAVMAVWGAPVAHEDDAERAVRAALELVDAIPSLGHGIQARCGVLSGEVAVTLGAVGEGMVAGDIVNTAARLQSAAAPGTVLVGESTQRATNLSIAFEEAGEQALKGKAAPVPAWRALRVVAERGGRNRSEGLEAPFVGRTEELRLIKDLFHATGRERRLRLVSVMGPGGIGKSRLAWEFSKYIDGLVESVWWHDGRCPSYGDGVSFWALGEMIRGRCGLAEDDDEPTTRAKVAATLAEHIADPEERRWLEPALLALLGVGQVTASEELFAAWRTFFERLAATAPVVMVFEDLHFADSGLLEFIDSLLDWSRNAPIYVLTLARPELLERRPDWGAGKRVFNSLPLDPLPDAVMRELLAGLVPGLPEPAVKAIVGRADGIPLYAVETVRMLVADGRLVAEGTTYAPAGDLTELAVPETLTALIGARLDGLEPDDRSLVQDAAVLGQTFTLDALAAVSGRDAAALEPRLRGLVRREILTLAADPRSPERGQYGFVQAMIREVAYGTLARRDRRTRHLAAAAYFEAQGSEELAAALAGHYVAAFRETTEPEEAAPLAAKARVALAAAAERAATLGAHDQAVTFLLAAVDVTDDDGTRLPLLVAAGRSAILIGQYVRADELLAAAVEAAKATGDRDAIGDARVARGEALLESQRIDEAVRVLEEANADAAGLAEATRAALLSALSRAYMRAARHLEAVTTSELALPISERLGLDAITASTFINKAGSLQEFGRPREAIALLEAAREIAATNGWNGLLLRATNNLGVVVEAEAFGRARTLFDEALALAERLGDRGMVVWLIAAVVGSAYWIAEDWDGWLARVDETMSSDLDELDQLWLRLDMALLRAARGEPIEGSLEDLARFREVSTDPGTTNTIDDVEAMIAFIHGDGPRLRAHAEASLWADRAVWAYPAFPLASGLLLDGDVAGLRSMHARLAERVSSETGVLGSTVAYVAAALALLEKSPAEALAATLRATALLEAAGNLMGVALAGLNAAAVLDPGDPGVAAVMERSRAIWGRVGARALLDRLDGVLAARTAGAR